MRARLTTALIRGSFIRNPGEIVEGKEAMELCAIGYAIPIKEDRVETAVLTHEKRERATVTKAKKG